ncbi:hypothetical protein KAFR_0K02280 [Kazachstania africana CBS 2517]|uniref:Cyclin N-terminal domain-containing protein n=1 Tax=Kazachstania africana (strain ATCC 22294 / BCRC 22015 / CBS 2517 / CECT 1963 / NBRC 1671 / NRRL Y-8276) TaxID=1071382 RepID=H2B1T2_KAZAF|nr:hypothetical protein KAFR_0K02280 [Kazachstania africana CBS 2517]CCF60582.1 hypothetical protein KAFR_0K02280 [Kazachstania africana CBS 2517]
MHQFTPCSKELASVHNDNISVNQDLQSHFAYQTPPYELNKTRLCNIDSKKRRCDSKNSSAALMDNITFLLYDLTSRFEKSKINNSIDKIRTFITEVLKRSKSNKHVAVLASFYFQKLHGLNSKDIPEFAKCPKRIFLVCLILAHKFSNDVTFSNKSWSLISGLKSKDLSVMERFCLNQLNYDLFIKPTVLTDWENELTKRSMKAVNSKRSYDEFSDNLSKLPNKKVCLIQT